MKILCKGKLVSNTEDSFGRRIIAGGVGLKRFQNNPVILGWHDSRQIPIGQATKLTVTPDNTMDIEFYLDSDLMPDKMTTAVRKGILKCLSSGLNNVPGGYKYDGNTGRELISMSEMTEASVVSLGRNADCRFEVIGEVDDKTKETAPS